MIAVCLLTSGRSYYTEVTLRTFAKHNAGRDLLLLHADDGSIDNRNVSLAKDYGFETVFQSPARTGGVTALRSMWNQAALYGCDRILHLENDFEWVSPLPDIDWPCVRLYGLLKGRGDCHSMASPFNLVTRQKIDWRPYIHGWEQSVAHFGGPPSIIKTPLLIKAVSAARTLKEIGLFEVDTIRPIDNIVWHIGEVTTSKAPC